MCSKSKNEYTYVEITQGGYDYEFCGQLPDECPCKVCGRVQREPSQVMCCGKIFCESCLNKVAASNSTCFKCCSNSIKEEKFFPDLNTKRKINNLLIYCKNKKNGCEWAGCLKDFKERHISECPNEVVRCTNKKKYPDQWFYGKNYCEASVQRHQLEQHMTKECPWRKVHCDHCFISGAHYFITKKHLKECPDFKISCTNKDCEVTVKRELLADHQNECPKVIIPCQYSSVGCTARVAREEIKTHNQEHLEEHLNKTAKTLEDVMQRLHALEASSRYHQQRSTYNDTNESDHHERGDYKCTENDDTGGHYDDDY